ncbi:MAG TPA: HD domain-containing phosphohydrolase [Trueperaceae bacterium]|nr:HD domain-containing phosphohydrolase [Trueperaceae bacterium]
MRNVKALLGPLVGSLFAFLVFWLLFTAPESDPVLAAPVMHFWIVSLTSLLAAALALIVGLAGAREQDARVVYLAAGFAGMAGLFALHGLSTPGMLIGFSVVTPMASQLALVAFAGWMVAAAYLRPVASRTHLVKLLAGWSLAVVLFDAVLLAWPDLARLVPVQAAPLQYGVAATVIALLAIAGLRFLEGYRLARSAIHLVMLHVIGWVMVSQLIIVLGEVFRLSWWLYHGILLTAIVTMLVTFSRQMQAGKLHSSLAALLDDDVGRRLSYGLRPEVRALVVATEARDPYTAGHMQRVAAMAVRLGKELGLQAEELRVLAQAGVVHDVGKIEVPDTVLNKQGPLEAIRHHHERFNGTGYPDGLSGDEIPLLARIMAVADVYDAVTSARAYRPAWSYQEAKALILREIGVGFDPVIARAMLKLLAAEHEPQTQEHTERVTKTLTSKLVAGQEVSAART